MNVLKFLTLIFVMFMSFNVFPSYIAGKKKHSHALLTDDYQILSKADFTDDLIAQKPFDSESGELNVDMYWQCFPRSAIKINLKEMDYSSEDIAWSENYSDLTIAATRKNGVRHDYIMRRPWPLSTYLAKRKAWLKLMENEKYVCIAGSTSYRENNKVFVWFFEQLKTKKGCDSYFFGDCA